MGTHSTKWKSWIAYHGKLWTSSSTIADSGIVPQESLCTSLLFTTSCTLIDEEGRLIVRTTLMLQTNAEYEYCLYIDETEFISHSKSLSD